MISIKTQARDRLFYDGYHYAVKFRMTHAAGLRNLTHKSIDSWAAGRNQIIMHYRQWEDKISEQDVAQLHRVADILLTLKEPSKRMIFNRHVYLYTNCLEDVHTVAASTDITKIQVTQADVCLPRDVVLLAEPKHKYRTYLKERWIPDEQTLVLRKFLLGRENMYGFTPLFKHRLTFWEKFYTMSHFFVDHDDPGDLLMLEMVCPGLIRKTLPIQAK